MPPSDKDHCRNQLYESLGSQIQTEAEKLAGALHSTAPHAKGNVEKHAEAEQHDEKGRRHSQIGGDPAAGADKDRRQSEADQPGAPHEKLVDRCALGGHRGLGNQLCGDKLVRKVDTGGEHQQGDGGGGLTEVSRSKQVCDPNVVAKVGQRHQDRAG